MLDLEFTFAIDKRYITHLKEKSYYNHNFYKLYLQYYGDYIIPQKCNILYQECQDDDYDCYYTLGYFENDKFVACFTWRDNAHEFYGVEEE